MDPVIACELFETYRPKARNIAKRLVGIQDADDCVQDAAVKVFQSAGQFQGRSSVTTWFHAIVRSVSVDFLRKRVRRGQVEECTERCVMVEPAAERDMLDRERRAALRLGLTRLPARERSALDAVLNGTHNAGDQAQKHLRMRAVKRLQSVVA